MFSVQICGGLGNQLFQIFAAIAYSISYRVPLALPRYGSNRPTYWSNFLRALEPIVTDNCAHFRNLNEVGFEYVDIPFINHDFKLVGYFQSYKYFERHYDGIYKSLKIDESIAELRGKIQDRIDADNTISLHIRCGDYKELQDHHPLLPTNYYTKAIEEIINKTERDNWDLIYFYEPGDHDYVRSMINSLSARFNNMNFMSVEHDLQDYEQLLLMSLCRNNIIANSSFSWWGAYLNSNKDKIVCRPSIWFGIALSHNIKDLCPAEWNVIDI